MCSLFWQISMENDQGDLADIVRASGGGGGGAGTTHKPPTDWQFPSEPINCQLGMEEGTHNFGDPFSSMRDPLLHQLDIAGSGFFDNPNSTGVCKIHVEDNSSVSGSLVAQKILDDEMRPCNIFSRMLQISPNVTMPVSPSNISTMAASPRVIKTSSVANDMVRANSFAGCSAENGGVQISPPQNPVIKRRKHQAKKVVCIPAPAAANSRPSGEVVPSDLWAWRKYGQKPIKGSPYPRGYYRCSSSKGCSARKQVERSRADPNMLVITYTSEHNHPWPTQRNALAGSTRSQPTKNNPTSKNSLSPQTQKSSNLKEEHIETNLSAPVKDEMAEPEKSVVMDGVEFNRGYYQSYRPAPPDSNQPDDFFADLGEIEPDPLNLLFSNGFNGEKSDEEGERKAMDPFSLFDWVGNN